MKRPRKVPTWHLIFGGSHAAYFLQVAATYHGTLAITAGVLLVLTIVEVIFIHGEE